MTYNELTSHPLKYHFANYWAIIITIIKTGNLTAGVWPFSTDFYDNNFKVDVVPKNARGWGWET